MKPDTRHLSIRRVTLALAPCLVTSAAHAIDVRPGAAGLEVDLLPPIASAAAGEGGGALQVRVGASRDGLRLVGAPLRCPSAFVSQPFADRSATVIALLYDRFFRDDDPGPRIAVGAEHGWSRIGLDSAADRSSWGTRVSP